MKKVLIAVGMMLSLNAFANDGGMAYIDVKGIDPAGLHKVDGVKMYGGDARKLFDLLPAVSSVSPEIEKTNHGLALVSNGYNLFINCEAKSSAHSDVNCSISAMKVEDPNFKYDALGDAFKFEKEMVCR